MTISALIEQLQDIFNEQGDCEIIIDSNQASMADDEDYPDGYIPCEDVTTTTDWWFVILSMFEESSREFMFEDKKLKAIID